MYQQKDLIKAFEKVIAFHKIKADLIQVIPVGNQNYNFFIKETKQEIDTATLERSLENQLGIKPKVLFMGMREKAQSLGGCGPCGRELCCASWLSNIPEVSNNCLKGKDFSDPSEYLGMCGKLRCCLAFLDDNFKLPDQTERKETPKKEVKEEHKKEAPPAPKPKKKQKVVRTLNIKLKKKR